MRHFTIIGLLITLFNTIIPHVYGQVGGNDINVAPSATQYFKNSCVSVAYDGTIYVGRLYSVTPGGPYENWEVVKSLDGGVTFSPFQNGSASGYLYTSLDIVAAGNNNADFKLFVARSLRSTSGSDSEVILSKIDASGNPTTINLKADSYSYSTVRGFESVSLATDSRDKNSLASPYSISLAASKAGVVDSVIVWTDNVGGTNLQRTGLHSTSNYIRKVSASIGSSNSSISGYGRLGVAWEEFVGSSDLWGKIHVKYVYPDDATSTTGGGPHPIGTALTGYRNPSLALSQNTESSSTDIRTIVIYEYDYTSLSEGTNIYARTNDNIIGGSPNFSDNPIIAEGPGEQINPHISYNPVDDNFLITYYDDETKALVYQQKTLASASALNPTTVSANYRQSQHNMVLPFPKVDMGTTNNKAVFVWNDADTTKFDAEQSHLSIQENTVNITELLLFPNPAQDISTLKFMAESNDQVQLRVMDMAGKLISLQKANTVIGENMLQLNVENMAPGRYLLYMTGENTNGTIAFIVAR